MNKLPDVGQFLRPIGSIRCWKYSLRVIEHFTPCKDWSTGGFECERWGLQDGRPYDDGHINSGHLIELEPTFVEGVYRCPPATRDQDAEGDDYRYAQPSVRNEPVYFRAVRGPDDQIDMFAG
ncbi:hypothetical protein [Microbulbifer sp. SAOS-129_SWC]|uniref:hypothetical protein n=1 Tax=Microbulbifer sp. SAOS-129_SWC TaxID=3145235 RepID=UPI003217AFA1